MAGPLLTLLRLLLALAVLATAVLLLADVYANRVYLRGGFDWQRFPAQPCRGLDPAVGAAIPLRLHLTYKTVESVPARVLQRWTELNPEYRIEVSGDAECEAFLRTSQGEHAVRVFRGLRDGPIRSDFWRLCVLWEHGGVYSDIDNNPVLPLRECLDEPGASLYVCTSLFNLVGAPSCNPILLAASPRNPIIGAAMQMYLDHSLDLPYHYWRHSIMFVLGLALRDYGVPDRNQAAILPDVHGQKVVLFEETVTSFLSAEQKLVVPDLRKMSVWQEIATGVHAAKNNSVVLDVRGRVLLRNRGEDYRDHAFVE